jgi:dolichyl-phosphate beta-glucosyltransferase
MINNPEFSIIIPAYNEERRLSSTLQQLYDFMASSGYESYEVIVVDDGSTDSTRAIVIDFQDQHRNLRLIENNHSGKSYTVRTGLLEANGEYSIHADADFSATPKEFTKLLDPLREGSDVAIGIRSGRPGAPVYRKMISIGWRLLVSIVAVRGFEDTQCGFKAFKTESARRILKYTRLYNTPEESLANARVTAASDVEMLFVARKLGFEINQVNLAWTHADDTKMNPIRDSLVAMADLFRIRFYDILGYYEF